MSEKHESETVTECTACGYTHPVDVPCDDWIAGDCWDCMRCGINLQLEDGLEMPRHGMCHPCATAALDEVSGQLAEATAERDATRAPLRLVHHVLIGDEEAERADNARLARDVLRGVEALEESLRATERALDAASFERDALKRRVEELEASIHLDARLSLLSEKTEIERMLVDTPENDVIGRASLTARLKNVEANLAEVDRAAFSRHLDESSAIVATWPEWKQNTLGRPRGD